MHLSICSANAQPDILLKIRLPPLTGLLNPFILELSPSRRLPQRQLAAPKAFNLRVLKYTRPSNFFLHHPEYSRLTSV